MDDLRQRAAGTAPLEQPHGKLTDVVDPLGIRAATRRVLDRAASVRLAEAGIQRVARDLASDAIPHASWRIEPHWWDDAAPERTARYVLLLDALNFSFWGEPKWRIGWRGDALDGYWALAAALRRAIEAGEPLLDAHYLATRADAASLLRGEDDTEIPLLPARQAALVEVGRALEQEGAVALVARARHSGAALVRLVAERLPSFRDVSSYAGEAVPFYKRAQILVSDLWGAFEGNGPGQFDDLADLTMFADYKVPQVLQTLGVLDYAPSLVDVLRARQPILYGDPREVEIRAAGVQAVEQLCAEIGRLGGALTATDVDWRLWSLGQDLALDLPYHRTRTIYY